MSLRTDTNTDDVGGSLPVGPGEELLLDLDLDLELDLELELVSRVRFKGNAPVIRKSLISRSKAKNCWTCL